MSNQIGDRYTCSDPSCGCEIEIKRPCGMLLKSGEEFSSASDRSVPSRTAGEPSNISTQDDFGRQGATGEGIFGTAGSATETATRQGRYSLDTASSRLAGSEDRGDSDGQNAAPTCFCGNKMDQARAQSTRSARIG